MTFPKGIDVAGYQSETYATAGVDFVVIKVTEGTTYRNPKYAAQLAHARAAGLIVGHYHYGHHGKAAAEAAFFLANAKISAGDFIAYDWEDGATVQSDRDTWMKAVKAKQAAHKVLLYCNKTFWRQRDSENYAGDGLWIADPSSPAGHPDVTHPWLVHQYSETGGLDHNVANFSSVKAFRDWLLPPAHPASTGPRKLPAGKVPKAVPFPGAAWFRTGRRSPIIAAMHKRLVAEGCNHYRSAANADTWGSGDVASYAAWQRKLKFRGSDADGKPGATSWDKLKVVV